MGADSGIWGSYSPSALYSLLVDKWEISLPLPRAFAVLAFGKWAYYLSRENYHDTPAGRLAASEKIAGDIFRETKTLPAVSAVYSTLQNANAYLRKELNLPPAERGLMSVTAWAARKLKRGAAEAGARASETGAAIKEGLTPPKWLFSPWTFGAAFVLLAAGVAANYIPKRKG